MKFKALVIVAVAFFLLAALQAHEDQAYAEETAAVGANAGPVVNKGLDGLSVGALWFLSFQAGEVGDEDYSRTVLKRGYLNIVKEVLRWDNAVFEARITPDVHQDDSGDFNVRLKYLYGKFKWTEPSWQPWVEFGLVHGPWFDFEEHINLYRMQGTMFIERNGTLNSADVGLALGGFLGPKIENAGKYPGKYGSFMFGVYNGGGYHAKEMNTNKAIEGRISLRPLPERARGLQLTYFGVVGKGNTEQEPDWTVSDVMLSFEHERFTATAQFYAGEGNQNGDAVDEQGEALSRRGYSVFGELKLPFERKISLMGRFDHFDFDTDADNDEADRVIAGVAWDLGHHNTLLLDFDRLDPKDDAKDVEKKVQFTMQVKY